MPLDLLHPFSELGRGLAQTRARKVRMQEASDMGDDGLVEVYIPPLGNEPRSGLMIPADPAGEACSIHRARERHVESIVNVCDHVARLIVRNRPGQIGPPKGALHLIQHPWQHEANELREVRAVSQLRWVFRAVAPFLGFSISAGASDSVCRRGEPLT